MSGYPVYRFDPATKTLVRIGSIIEMRKSRRSMNRVSLSRLAQRVFADGSEGMIYIGPQSALERIEAEPDLSLLLSAG